jgi:hypothetical protein
MESAERSEIEKCYKRVILDTLDGGLSPKELKEIFDTESAYNIILAYSAGEIVSMIKAYDQQSEIHTGDEVVCKIDKSYKFVATSIDRERGRCTVMSATGQYGTFELDQLEKTGKKYPITEIRKNLTF